MGRNLVNTDRVDKKLNIRLVIPAVLLLAVVFGLAISGLYWWIGYRESITDRSLFTGLPCAPPCWQGIVPGETTAQEAMQILQSSPYVKKESIGKTGSYTLGAIEAYWEVAPGGVVIGLQDGLVRDITFNTPYRLTLGQVMEEFGPPESLMVYTTGVPESLRWGIAIHYPSSGMEFSMGGGHFENPSLEPSTQIGAVRFVTPQSSLEGLLGELYDTYETRKEGYLSHSRPWKGYGRLFEVYYDSPQDAMW
jgi:hypothetical protein